MDETPGDDLTRLRGARGARIDGLDANKYHSQVLDEPRKPSRADPVRSIDGEQRSPVRRVASEELLGRAGELVIEHGGREYRLRITQHGKLILTA